MNDDASTSIISAIAAASGGNNDTMTSMTMPMTSTSTMIEIPQWLIDAQHLRRRLFLRIVEPIIVLLLGPVVDTSDDQADSSVAADFDDNNATNYNYYNDATASFTASSSYASDSDHRRLSFLPSWVENPNYSSNHTSMTMTFATLTMMYIIMSVILLVFLSCFYHNQKTSPLFVSPRRHRLPKLVPPPLPVDGAFSWMKVCLLMSDEEVSSEVPRIIYATAIEL
jgi:hypothetical protein